MITESNPPRLPRVVYVVAGVAVTLAAAAWIRFQENRRR